MKPDRIVLWRPRAAQWREARRLKLATVPWREYLARLRIAVAEARRQGVPVAWCRASPRRVLAALRARRWANTPDNRAAIYVLLLEED